MPELSVVVVNWNTRALLQRCLSCLKPLLPRAEVIVIDNGSVDGSADLVEEMFPWVRLIKNPSNVGYATANNQGWVVARGSVILFLNSDTLPDPDAISDMILVLRADTRVGIVGPFLRNPIGRAQVGAAGWDLTLRSAASYQLFLHRILPRSTKPFYIYQPAFRGRGIVTVEWVSGAAMMIRREALEAVEGLPEHSFMYAEDIALCRLVRIAGFEVKYLPDIEIIHIHGASHQGSSPNARWIQPTIAYYRSLHGPLRAAILATLFALGAVIRMAAVLPLVVIPGSRGSADVHRYVSYIRASMRAAVTR